MPEGTLRLFVAVELPKAVRTALDRLSADLRARIRSNVRWARAGSMHLTLRFLGDTGSGLVAPLGDALRQAIEPLAPFTIVPAGAGIFPNSRDPRVIWAGFGGDVEALGALHRAVEDAVRACGVKPDDKPFRAHITLGRIRERIRGPATAQLSDVLSDVDLRGSPSIEVREAVLFKSELHPGGARHTPLEAARLQG